MFDGNDLHVAIGYSLPRSKHAALRLIATHEGHKNATRVLDAIVEAYLRENFGRHWQHTIETTLARQLAADDERLEALG